MPHAHHAAVRLYIPECPGNDRGPLQVCLPVRDLDLSYNLISTHDRDGVYVLVDHDEEDVVAANAPINNVYTPGTWLVCGGSCLLV